MTSSEAVEALLVKHKIVRTRIAYFGVGTEAATPFKVIKLRIERMIGEILWDMVRAGNPSLSKTHKTIPAGITRRESSKWQRLADIPEEQFELYLKGTRISLSGVLSAG